MTTATITYREHNGNCTAYGIILVNADAYEY